MAGRREPLQAAKPVPVQSPHPFFPTDAPRNACAMTGMCLCHRRVQQAPLERATGCLFHYWRQKPSPGGSGGSHSTGRTPKAKSWQVTGSRLCWEGGQGWAALSFVLQAGEVHGQSFFYESSPMPGSPFVLGEIITRGCRELGLVGLSDAKAEKTGRCG